MVQKTCVTHELFADVPKGGDWVLIFDNVSDFDLIRPYWPVERQGCAVVITSREHGIGSTAISLRLGLKDLAQIDAANIIMDILSEVPRTTDNVELAKEIWTEVGGLPLAINQVGCYIQKYGCGLKKFLPLYRRMRKKIHEAKVNLPDYPDTIYSIWLLCLEQINAETRTFEEVLAFLHPDRVPMEFFLGFDSDDVEAQRPHLRGLMYDFM